MKVAPRLPWQTVTAKVTSVKRIRCLSGGASARGGAWCRSLSLTLCVTSVSLKRTHSRRVTATVSGSTAVGQKSPPRTQPHVTLRNACPSSWGHSPQRLGECCNARPGQLGQRLSFQMDELVWTGGEAVVLKEGQLPAVLSAYSHVVIAPIVRETGSCKPREARTLCRALETLVDRGGDLTVWRESELQANIKDGLQKGFGKGKVLDTWKGIKGKNRAKGKGKCQKAEKTGWCQRRSSVCLPSPRGVQGRRATPASRGQCS